MIPTWAVLATRQRKSVGNDVVLRCLESLKDQVTGFVIVDNNNVAQVELQEWPDTIHIWDSTQPPNLSRMLNEGMDMVPTSDEFNIALVNDDVTFPPGWVDQLSSHLRPAGPAAAYIEIEPQMTCWACLVRGEIGLRWDEELLWWFSDRAFERLCMQHGGVAHVPGVAPTHHHPSQQTMESTELSIQAHKDAETFARKYGG